MSPDELYSLTELAVSNIGLSKIIESMKALEHDHVFKKELESAVRNQNDLERIGSAFMVAVYRFAQAEIKE